MHDNVIPCRGSGRRHLGGIRGGIIHDQSADLERLRLRVVIFNRTLDLIVWGPGLLLHDQRRENVAVADHKTADLDQVDTRNQIADGLSRDTGADDGTLVNMDNLPEGHQTQAVRRHRLDNPFDGFFKCDLVGDTFHWLAGGVFFCHPSIDEHDHAEFEPVLGAAGLFIDTIERAGIVVLRVGHVHAAELRNRTRGDARHRPGPSDSSVGLRAWAA